MAMGVALWVRIEMTGARVGERRTVRGTSVDGQHRPRRHFVSGVVIMPPIEKSESEDLAPVRVVIKIEMEIKIKIEIEAEAVRGGRRVTGV